jgi:hydroxymethylglutaryl-CoA lyase
MPQMADCATLVREANKLENLNVQALVPNLKGAELAIAAGARKLTMPISASTRA